MAKKQSENVWKYMSEVKFSYLKFSYKVLRMTGTTRMFVRNSKSLYEIKYEEQSDIPWQFFPISHFKSEKISDTARLYVWNNMWTGESEVAVLQEVKNYEEVKQLKERKNKEYKNHF